jgi:hypothetical protein
MDNAFAAYDSGEYKWFTGPQELDKAVHVLEGILRGIASDGVIRSQEISVMRAWCDRYGKVRRKHPFSELIPLVEASIEDGVLDVEERQDILWFCEKCTTGNEYFNIVTSDMQRLQGILGGIAADGIIAETELRKLSEWLQDHDHLKCTWPYDEIDSLVTTVMGDGKVDEDEQKILLDYFSEFVGRAPFLVTEPRIGEDLIRHGVCAMCPEIVFQKRSFCFSGRSAKASRTDLAHLVRKLGGEVISNVTRAAHYLVVGGEGNSAWAFSCYGRKVEAAVQLRKEGLPIQIIHEFDFWDAVQDVQ